jgi:hypothetical protein
MPVPPQIPVISFNSPAFGDRTLTELWNTEVASYEELPYGTPHSDTAKWPNFLLVKQAPVEGDEKWVLRIWTEDAALENTYNDEAHGFDGEDIVKDIVSRSYLVRRATYTPATKKTKLTGILYAAVSAPGSGYDSTTTVAITGGGGSGATATPIVFRGKIAGAYITAEGSNYTSNATLVFSGPGTGATGTAFIQRNTAILVEESAQRFPEGSPDDGLYLKVTRVYHVLPGAELVSYKSAAGGKLKRITRQKVALPYYPTATGPSLLAEAVEAISTIMGWRVREDWVNTDGTTTSSVPWIAHHETVEPEGIQLSTWIKSVEPGIDPPPMGRDYLETPGDMAPAALYGGLRRIPTFPTGITNAGQWQDAQAYIVHSEARDDEDEPNRTLVVQTAPIPRDRYEFPNQTWTFPALLTYNTDTTPTALVFVNGKLPLRMDGGIQYLPRRTRHVVACILHKYSTNQFAAAALSPTWYLSAPGAGSVFFGQLTDDTIYKNFATVGPPANPTTVQIFNSASALIEEFPFSSMTGCYPTTTTSHVTPTWYRLEALQSPWKGNLWERAYVILREDGDIRADAQAGQFDSVLNPGALFPNA